MTGKSKWLILVLVLALVAVGIYAVVNGQRVGYDNNLLTSQVTALTEAKEDLEKDLGKAESKLAEVEESLAAATASMDEMSAAAEASETVKTELQSALDAANASIEELTSSAASEVEAVKSELGDKLAEAEAKIEELTASAASEVEAVKSELGGKLAEAEAKIEELTAAPAEGEAVSVSVTDLGSDSLGGAIVKTLFGVDVSELPVVVAENVSEAQAQVYIDLLAKVGVTAEAK